MIEIGASTLGFRHDSLDVALHEIARQGFRMVDVVMIPSYCPHFNPVTAGAAEKEALKEQLSELELRVAALNVGEGLLGIPKQREAAMTFSRASAGICRATGRLCDHDAIRRGACTW